MLSRLLLELTIFMVCFNIFIGYIIAKPFQHSFGELREYHKDWLSVCPNRYDPKIKSDYYQNCWASTYAGGKGAAPSNRLSVLRNRFDGSINIDILIDDYQLLDKNRPLIIRFNSKLEVKYIFKTDIAQNGNVINEYRFQNQDKVRYLVKYMQNYRRAMFIIPRITEDRIVYFSLSGFTSSLRFLKKYAVAK